ncbi:glycosyltransferase family 4 protein [Paractinoplanes ferrugineus]|uniref:Galactosyltransferase n=2 Tax=Paractinoplanes ferrugineus TaxID=113564 RepID=A0A919ITU6_9ACTN|nr:galactosyltransferase [Actinoplanes ferrugineus]
MQITPYYPPHLGGLERVVENLATGLGDRHDVRVLTTTIGSGDAPRRSRVGAVQVRRHRSIEFAHTPLAPGLFGSLLRAPRSAVLHLHTAHAVLPELVALVALIRRQRFLVHFHLDVDGSGRLGWLLPAYKKHVFARVLRAAAGVIVLTRSQAAWLHETYRVREERIFVVPNGVGAAYFMAARPLRRLSDGPLELLFVGRLSPQKNVSRLLQAMSLVRRPIHLTVVGDGELRAELRELAARLHLTNVTFVGARLGADLARSYADADAFVLPSDKEGMPLVALEAMAAALPIVATAVPGNTDLLGDVALMVRPDPASLAEALDAIAGDPLLAQAHGDRSVTAARQHDWATVVRRVEDVYAEVLS